MSLAHANPKKQPFGNFKYIKGKYLVFRACIWTDGMGDLGHFIDLTNPRVLEKVSKALGIRIDTTPAAFCHPAYFIGHVDNEKVAKRVRAALIESGILQKQKSSIPAKTLIDISTFADSSRNQAGFPQWSLPVLPDHCSIFEISTVSEAVTMLDQTCCTRIKEHGPRSKTPKDLFEYKKKTGTDPLFFQRVIEHQSLGYYSNDLRLLISEPRAETLSQKAQLLLKMRNQNFVRDLVFSGEEKELDQQSTEAFLQKTLFIPAYFQSITNLKIFIQAILRSPLLKNYSTICFYINKEIYLDFSFLAAVGIANFVNHRGKSAAETTKIESSNDTKTLRFYHNYDLNDEDYQSLYAIAQIIGGCSGDKTLEYCLSNYLLFISQVRSYKKSFYDHLVETLALYTENKNILEYLSLINNNDLLREETLARMLSLTATSSFLEDWRKMCRCFCEKHNYYDIYPDVIRKNLMIHELFTAILENDHRHADEVLAHFNDSELENVCKLARDPGLDDDTSKLINNNIKAVLEARKAKLQAVMIGEASKEKPLSIEPRLTVKK